jgi:pimeloyl-ACP methyl ester carboxylesterase
MSAQHSFDRDGRFTPRPAPPGTPNPGLAGPSSRSFISQRLRLHYADWGNADAPTVILLHGVADHCRSWDWVAEDLRADFHVVALDLRGHGDSAHAPAGVYTEAVHLCDVVQLLRAFDHSRVTLVGHALGGALALAIASIYPSRVAKVVAIEGLGDPPAVMAARAGKPMHRRLADFITERQGLSGRIPRRYASIEEAFARMRWHNPRLTPEQALHLTEHGVDRHEDGAFTWKFDNYVRAAGAALDFNSEQLQELWSNIVCPVLLMFGADGGGARAIDEGQTDSFAAARIEVVDGAGHWVHHDQLGAFLAALRAFL